MNTYFQDIPEDVITLIFDEILSEEDFSNLFNILEDVLPPDYFERQFKIKFRVYPEIKRILEDLGLISSENWMKIFSLCKYKFYPVFKDITDTFLSNIDLYCRLNILKNKPELYPKILELDTLKDMSLSVLLRTESVWIFLFRTLCCHPNIFQGPAHINYVAFSVVTSIYLDLMKFEKYEQIFSIILEDEPTKGILERFTDVHAIMNAILKIHNNNHPHQLEIYQLIYKHCNKVNIGHWLSLALGHDLKLYKWLLTLDDKSWKEDNEFRMEYKEFMEIMTDDAIYTIQEMDT